MGVKLHSFLTSTLDEGEWYHHHHHRKNLVNSSITRLFVAVYCSFNNCLKYWNEQEFNCLSRTDLLEKPVGSQLAMKSIALSLARRCITLMCG